MKEMIMENNVAVLNMMITEKQDLWPWVSIDNCLELNFGIHEKCLLSFSSGDHMSCWILSNLRNEIKPKTFTIIHQFL